MLREDVVKSSKAIDMGQAIMPSFTINFDEQESMPDKMKQVAADLDITVEQLIMRFVAEGMSDYEPDGPSEPGSTLRDFLQKNGALKPN